MAVKAGAATTASLYERRSRCSRSQTHKEQTLSPDRRRRRHRRTRRPPTRTCRCSRAAQAARAVSYAPRSRCSPNQVGSHWTLSRDRRHRRHRRTRSGKTRCSQLPYRMNRMSSPNMSTWNMSSWSWSPNLALGMALALTLPRAHPAIQEPSDHVTEFHEIFRRVLRPQLAVRRRASLKTGANAMAGAAASAHVRCVGAVVTAILPVRR